MKKEVVGILAHVDAGKTTLIEAMLYQSGTLSRLGRVDHRDSFLDHTDQERARGITIFSKQAQLQWKDLSLVLLDTPGHVDFSTEMERALQIMDYAVLVISGTDGVQAHTETLWRLLQRYSIPTFLFVTKMDVSFAQREERLAELRSLLGEGCVDLSESSIQECNEAIAMLDEDALEEYTVSGNHSVLTLSRLIAERKLFPCLFGSGLKNDGVEALLDTLNTYTLMPPAPKIFGAKVYKIARDNKGKRLTYCKITGGQISVRDTVRYLSPHSDSPLEEKISEIRLYSGQKYVSVETVEPGSVCALLGLSGTLPGQGLGSETDAPLPSCEPVLGCSLILPKGTDPKAILPKLRQLEEEDPLLHILWDSSLGEIRFQLMGTVQTEVLKSLLKERFDLDVSFGPGRILYRETIADTVEGVGHYEPLRHYAEVHLILEPGERGSGLVFDSDCSTDSLDLNWQRLILTHLEEKIHRGVLTGAPITDMRITLVSGRAHLKHTEGGDFRQATYRAVRQGLMQAKSVLLEPYYEFHLDVPTEQIGRAISDVHAMGATHSAPESSHGHSTITGLAPVAAMAGYAVEVAAYTGGRGRLSCQNGGYLPCANAQSVIEQVQYAPERDLENSPDSVFCAHGAGFVVKWNEVPNYMHLPSVLQAQKEESAGNADPSAASPVSRSVSIDEKELEAIMTREFGPIRRKQYAVPTVNGTKVSSMRAAARKERLIVDGYNLIFAWPELKALSGENLDLAREKLVEIMINFSGFTNRETVLVFDAYKVPGGQGEKYDSASLHVAYTRENESADLYIERLADEIGKDEQVRVVTSDSLIRLTALRAGVLRTSSQEFKAEVEDALALMRRSPFMSKNVID